MRKIFYSLLGAVFLQSAVAQDMSNYVQTITKDDLKKHLSILASDEYEGRETGKKGQKMAAEYLKKEFEKLGLKAPVNTNPENPYFQPVELVEKSWGKVSLANNKKSAKFLEEFFVFGNFDLPTTELDFVFAGYGIDNEKYSDYKNLDVKGKGVVVFMGEPVSKDGIFLISGTAEGSAASKTNAKVRTAMQKGAKAIIFVYNNPNDFSQTLNYFKNYAARPSLALAGEQATSLAMFYTLPKTIAELMGTDEKKLMKNIESINKKKQTTAGKLSAKLKVTAERKVTKVMSENILGFMEGTDKKDEILAITAHYDHIGISPDGQINNGADDDGSGTVSVLEIAEAFQKAKADGKAPRRSILFMLFTGEEKGLLGSEYYSKNPVFEMKNTVTNLNIDMVGRVDAKHESNPNYIYVIGTDMLSSELHQISEKTAKEFFPEVQLDYTYNNKTDPNRFYYRSDHYNFAKHGVPVIFYFNGTHEDYHMPTDDVDKIHFDKMEKVVRLIFGTAWQIANRDARPVVDKTDGE